MLGIDDMDSDEISEKTFKIWNHFVSGGVDRHSVTVSEKSKYPKL
jgi:hypothetical protein